jgi:phage portal protein BeeE
VKLLSRLQSQAKLEERMSFDQYVALMSLYGHQTPQTSYGTEREAIATDFLGNAQSIHKRNGPVFALIAFRMALFSQVRWSWQQMRSGRPGDLFSNPALDLLNDDAELNKWMILDNDLAGNFYGLVRDGKVTRLRPDWVQVIGNGPLERYDTQILGYAYYENGSINKTIGDAELFFPREIIHWYDQIDPESKWRGMSWLSPVAREVAADNAATTHKLKFFENAATPNLVFKFDEKTSPANVREFRELVEMENAGVHNAYRDLFLGGGADVTVVGSDLKQLEFSMTQGKGESRLASAARVPAVLVGFSEGLQAATYSNFSQARRAAADGLLHPLWVSAAGAVAKTIAPPDGARLWYDARDIPFLREDAMDDAEIKAREAQTIRTLVDAGYEPESVVSAVQSGDWSRLVHTKLFSVQLQPPGAQAPEPAPERSFVFEGDEGRSVLRVVHE